MLRTCLDSAASTGGSASSWSRSRSTTKDLHEDGDEHWLAPAAGEPPLTSARTWRKRRRALRSCRGRTACAVAARGGPLGSQESARAWSTFAGWRRFRSMTSCARRATGRVLVVDETRRTGGVGRGLAALVDVGFTGGSLGWR